MIKEWIESYEPKNIQDTEQALREIMQEIALAGLYRANFFKHAAFYGGTALRILKIWTFPYCKRILILNSIIILNQLWMSFKLWE